MPRDRDTRSAPDNHVRAHRRRLDLTQARLAGRVGVSRQTIVSVENGGYAPSVYLALNLGAALGRTVEELFAPGPSAAAPRPAAQEAR